MHKSRASRDPYNPFVLSYSQRSKLLEAKFREFNKSYFDGRLPEYLVLLCSKPKPFGHEVAGYCLTAQKKILIRNGLGKKSTLQTLVHEMAHVKMSKLKRGVHGKQFAKELVRLRKLGAPLSPLDIDTQDNPQFRLLTQREVKQLIEDALLVEKLPVCGIPKFLERELSLPISMINQEIKVKPVIEEVFRRRRKILDSQRKARLISRTR